MKAIDYNEVEKMTREERIEFYHKRDFEEAVERAAKDKLDGLSFEKYYRIHQTYGLSEEEHKQAWEQAVAPEILVGTGCTIHYYSDSRAATITEVIRNKSGKVTKVGVRKNETKTIDYYAGEYEILDGLYGNTEYYTLRRGGYWINEGSPKNDWGSMLHIGERYHYIDPSF